MKYLYITLIIILFLSYSLIPSRAMKIINSLKRKKQGNIIYLTFDDGPGEYTSKLLDVLKKYEIKATFFVVADFAINNKEVIKRMIKEHHKIEFHSKSHKDAALLDYFSTYKEVVIGLKELESLNINPKYYRAPWGRYNIFSLIYAKKLNVKPILWNVMAEDWVVNTTSEEIEKKLLKRVKGGDIICLHDNRGFIKEAPLRTIQALDKAIPKLKNKGYIFEVIQ